MRMGGGAGFRGAQASIGGPRAGGNFGHGYHGRGDGRGYGYGGAGFAAGLAAGGLLGYGYGYPYDGYYGDDYAYDYSADPAYVASDPAYVVSNGDNAAYCAQRFKSYDPASGTYLGFDGLRHPCM